MTVAPIPQILPSFVPVQVEQALGGYYEVPLREGERRLTETELRRVIAAASFIGTYIYCSQNGFALDEVRQALATSLSQIPVLSIEDNQAVLDLEKIFDGYHIIRADLSLDDWITESWWSELQNGEYEYPSALSGAVAHGLGIVEALRTFRIEA